MTMMSTHSQEEQVVASVVASLKRQTSDVSMQSEESPPKKHRKMSHMGTLFSAPEKAGAGFSEIFTGVGNLPIGLANASIASYHHTVAMDDSDEETKERALMPAPFFFYRDHSQEPDDDPLTPLTPPARVPQFPAKMHAILSRPDFADVVAWMPHGRSWRVLKPREFEIRVIPTYFEHQKFSSFIRQANGWGFRRITQGPDRNSYYHELFLRGLPHLCKKMKRPGVNEKATADPEHEPDFYKISELHPVAESCIIEEDILLPCTLQGGPKARMPVHFGMIGNKTVPGGMPNLAKPHIVSEPKNNMASEKSFLTPHLLDQAALKLSHCYAGLGYGHSPHELIALANFHRALRASEGQVCLGGSQGAKLSNPGLASLLPPQPPLQVASLAAKQQAAVHQATSALSMAMGVQTNDAASQFAAGFAAAAALSNNQIRSVLGQALAASNAASALRAPFKGNGEAPVMETTQFPFSHNPPWLR